jgi:ligand-binding sensor domain-containing protein
MTITTTAPSNARRLHLRPARIAAAAARLGLALLATLAALTGLAALDDALAPPVAPLPAGRAPAAVAIVRSLAADAASGVLLAATDAGVFRSSDDGATWEPSSAGLAALGVQTVVFDARDGAVYAAVVGVGAFRSDDGGRTWRNISRGLPPRALYTLAQASQTGMLYAGTIAYGMYTSKDGLSWETGGMGLGDMVIRSVLPGLRPGELFAASDKGVYHTRAVTGTWDKLTSSLPNIGASALALDPRSGTVYAGTERGVLRFTPDGQRFKVEFAGLEDKDVQALLYDEASGGLLAATAGDGVHRSQDGAQTWTPLSGDLPVSIVRALLLRNGDLVAGTDSGIYRLPAGSEAWLPSAADPVDRHGLSLLVDPVDGTVYAGTMGGVFRSADRGATWQPASSGLGSLIVQSIALDHGAGLVYAATPQGVYQSPIETISWSRSGKALAGVDTQTVAVDERSGVAYAVTMFGDTFKRSRFDADWALIQTLQPVFARTTGYNADQTVVYVGAYHGGVFRTTDHGVNWQPVNGNLPDRDVEVVGFDSRDGALFAGTLSGGVFRDRGDGVGWERVGQPIPGPIMALAVEPRSGTLMAATKSGLFRVPPGETDWTPANAGLSNTIALALAVHPASGTVYAATSGGVFRSEDGGLTWSAATAGLDDAVARAVTIDPATGAVLAAVERRGVFRSEDGGLTWRAANRGLRDLEVRGLAADASDGSIALVTEQGEYRSVDGGASWQPHPGGGGSYADLILPINAYGSAGRLPGGAVLRASHGGGLAWARLGRSLATGEAAIDAGRAEVLAVRGAGFSRAGEGSATGRAPLAWMAARMAAAAALDWIAVKAPWWRWLVVALVALGAAWWLANRARLSFRFGLPLAAAVFRPGRAAALARPRAVDAAWPVWERAIKDQLYRYGDVRAVDLPRVPGLFRGYALSRYAERHAGAQPVGFRRGRLSISAGPALGDWSRALRALRRGLRRQRLSWFKRDRADQLADALARAVGVPVSPPRDVDAARAYAALGALPPPLPARLVWLFVADSDPGARTVRNLAAALETSRVEGALGAVIPLGAPGWRIDNADRLRAIVARAERADRLVVLNADEVSDALAARDPASALAALITAAAGRPEAVPAPRSNEVS